MTTNAPGVIHLERDYAHTPSEIWRALTNPFIRERWWAAGDLQPVAGHRFTLDMGRFGKQPCEVIAVEAESLLQYRFAEKALDTIITWRLAPDSVGTRLTLVHEGFKLATPMGQQAFEGMKAGWPVVLERLARVLAQPLAPPLAH